MWPDSGTAGRALFERELDGLDKQIVEPEDDRDVGCCARDIAVQTHGAGRLECAVGIRNSDVPARWLCGSQSPDLGTDRGRRSTSHLKPHLELSRSQLACHLIRTVPADGEDRLG